MKQGSMAALVVGALLTFATQTAAARDFGFYIGGSLGIGFIESADDLDIGDEIEAFDIDDDDFAWKAFVGFQFLPWLGVEGGYVDFGEAGDTTPTLAVTTEIDGWNAFLVGRLPVGPVDIFGKVGVIFWDVEFDIDDGLGDAFSSDGEDLAYGVGASINFGNLGIRAELELYDIDAVDDLFMLSAGLVYHF
jgi:hypothetical protein